MSILFSPTRIGSLPLKNRIVMAPMQQRQGTKEGFATAHHIEHYRARAKGGVALVIIESTAVAENGRLFQDDIGIFDDAHVPYLQKVTASVHAENVPVFVQLSHGGRKSSMENKGRLIAPSALPFDAEYDEPEEMSLADIQATIQQFAEAARRAQTAGFDGIELHGAHGYLLHQFLSPVANQRTDGYGGSLENRVRFLREVLTAVRRQVGADYPVIIRVSATDYTCNGLTPEEVAAAMEFLLPYGLDAIHVSSGGILPIPPDQVYPGYQVPFAETIKKKVDIPVIAVGLLHTPELAEQVLQAGQADLIAIGRPLLENANLVKEWEQKFA